jgi:hypothetical protein
MTSSDFDKEREEVFSAVWSRWPSKYKSGDNGNLAWGNFSSFATDEEWLEIFNKAYEAETVKTTLSQFIKGLAKKFEKVSVKQRPVVITQTPSPDIPHDKVSLRAQEVFQEIRAAWPVNKDHGEPFEVSQRAFEAACKERDVDELREACLGYCEAWHSGEITYRTPFWLKSFLSKNGLVDEYLGKQKNKPDPEVQKTFEAMWAWYPIFNGKDKESTKEDSFGYWSRMVKPEDYFDFMVAIRAYRMERRDAVDEANDEDVTQFTKGFIRFCKEWVGQEKYKAISTANTLCKEILWACREYRLDLEELWKNEMNQHIQGIQKFSKLNVERTAFEVLSKLTLLDLTNTYDPVFLLGISKEILKRAWNRALQLPKKGVLLESL